MESLKKKTKVTYNGTQIKNKEPQEHEFCIMERLQEVAFQLSDAHFLLVDLLNEPIFKKSTCFLEEDKIEIDMLDEMQNDLLSMYKEIKKTLSKFERFHDFLEDNDPCKCFEEFDEETLLYYRCPECRKAEEELGMIF